MDRYHVTGPIGLVESFTATKIASIASILIGVIGLTYPESHHPRDGRPPAESAGGHALTQAPRFITTAEAITVPLGANSEPERATFSGTVENATSSRRGASRCGEVNCSRFERPSG